MNRRTLGRGLSALLGGAVDEEAQPIMAQVEPGSESTVAIADIDANPFQPRTDFDPAELDGLAESIRLHGILQPVVVRRAGERFQLVAGERRLRAAQQLAFTHIPARIVELDDRQTCELALIENLQRKDLNAIEKAQAFHRYIQQFQSTHEDLASQLGIDRTTVTNLLRLLELPDAVQEMVVRGQISSGHARAILSIEDPIAQLTVANEIKEQGLNVRQTEALVRQRRTEPTPEAAPASEVPQPEHHEDEKSNHIRSIENELCQKLGTRVAIHSKDERGTFVLHFESNDEFMRILDRLRRD